MFVFSKAVLVKTFVFLTMHIIDAQCMIEIQHRISPFNGSMNRLYVNAQSVVKIEHSMNRLYVCIRMPRYDGDSPQHRWMLSKHDISYPDMMEIQYNMDGCYGCIT